MAVLGDDVLIAPQLGESNHNEDLQPSNDGHLPRNRRDKCQSKGEKMMGKLWENNQLWENYGMTSGTQSDEKRALAEIEATLSVSEWEWFRLGGRLQWIR